MQLLKVNYVHQCKRAIIHLASKSQDEYMHFGGYRCQSLLPSKTGPRSSSPRNVGVNPLSMSSLPPPTVESWRVVMQSTNNRKSLPTTLAQDSTPIGHTDDRICISETNLKSTTATINHKKLQNGEAYNDRFINEITGIKSRADRIAHIENRKSNPSFLKSYPNSRIPKLVAKKKYKDISTNHFFPKWMDQKPESISTKSDNRKPMLEPEWKSPRYQQNPKQNRVHIRKKRQSIKLINSAIEERNLPSKTAHISMYDHKKICNFTLQHNAAQNHEAGFTNKRLLKISFDEYSNFGTRLLTCNSCQTKSDNKMELEKCKSCKKISTDKNRYENIIDTIETKTHGDPNDLQNFAKKNLSKVTTNELLKAATEKRKQSNIEIERKLNDLKVKEEETMSNSSWVNESYIQVDLNDESDNSSQPAANNSSGVLSCPKENIKKTDINKTDLTGMPSLASVSFTDSESESDLESTYIRESDQSCCFCKNQFNTECVEFNSSNNLGYDSCNVEGIFCNSSYSELSTELTSSCCCSLSSCDEDKCSCCSEAFIADIMLPAENESQGYLSRNKAEFKRIKVSSYDAEARRLKRGHVLTELLETERIYVNEISSILKGYCDQLKSEELMHLVPVSLYGKEDILFGNLHELYTFHNETFLKDLENCISSTELVALCFVQRRDTFYRLYSYYCQNIPRSERLRENLVDTHMFLQECQKRLGHKLPLAAYLLKPVQRITKYQLLLKDLLRFCDCGNYTKELQKALDCMLVVLKCVNDSMHQIAITGFPTDLSEQGELLMQDSFQVWSEYKKDIRIRIKPQQRHIFLYNKSLLFCKQSLKSGHNKSTYQFKHFVKMSEIGLTESVRGDTKRFEVWLQGRQEVHTLQAPSVDVKMKWVAEIKRVLLNQLEELKGEKIKQYNLNHRGFMQITSSDTPKIFVGPINNIGLEIYSESSKRVSNWSADDVKIGSTSTYIDTSINDKDHHENCGWSSDCSNSEDELSIIDENNTPVS
ncbi:hypothetical protein KR018_004056, partial [Drosophila ironensis]